MRREWLSPTHFSATWDPSAEGIDFFAQETYDFSPHFTWINPPFQGHFIRKTLDSIVSWRISGILCVPTWLRSDWFWVARRFAHLIIRVSKKVKLFQASKGLKIKSHRDYGSPRWDSFLIVFNWKRNRSKTEYWRTEDMILFIRTDDTS